MSVIISNETVKQLFHIAQSIARENYNSTYGAPHLLQASVHQDIGLREFLQSIEKIRVLVRLGRCPNRGLSQNGSFATRS